MSDELVQIAIIFAGHARTYTMTRADVDQLRKDLRSSLGIGTYQVTTDTGAEQLVLRLDGVQGIEISPTLPSPALQGRGYHRDPDRP